MANNATQTAKKNLKRRIQNWENTPQKDYLETQGLKLNKPGSQNRNK